MVEVTMVAWSFLHFIQTASYLWHSLYGVGVHVTWSTAMWLSDCFTHIECSTQIAARETLLFNLSLALQRKAVLLVGTATVD